MSFEILLEKLSENSIQDSKEAVRLLVKIADSIINDPKNDKVRTLQKSNDIISKKILQISGGALCLKLMGFEESSTSFTFPAEAKLSSLYEAKDNLLMWKESVELSETYEVVNSSGTQNTNEGKKRPSIDLSRNEAWDRGNQTVTRPPIRPIPLPPLISLFKNEFLHRIEVTFHSCLQYENKDLQQRAKNIIPVSSLELVAQSRLRVVQEHIKINKLPDPDISIQDMLILELLHWFKEDFFRWVDSPDCEHCGNKTRFLHMTDNEALFVYTNRVEVHQCTSCNKLTPFARYNDLNILLETRKGRCGEWANTFTLLCRAMGWDSRFVMDETDHVWTEVYSITQKRWLHCDPCENVCDKPLLYESGWKKNISYVIAYSGEEVQDVTWRYTSHHKEVLKRRTHCSEQELVDALLLLRKKRQIKFSESRRDYLTKRLVMELVELMVEKKACDGEKIGRQSGDEVWRLARGEIQEKSKTEYIWHILCDENDTNVVTVRYSTSEDCYQLVVDKEVKKEVYKWNMGSFNSENVFRKEEKDWKQAYLARLENNSDGFITWKFSLDYNSKELDAVVIKFQTKTYENGIVSAEINSDDICEPINTNEPSMTIRRFSGCKTFTLTAKLSGGKGDVAWQHAQIFRQPIDSSDFPFSISFVFK